MTQTKVITCTLVLVGTEKVLSIRTKEVEWSRISLFFTRTIWPLSHFSVSNIHPEIQPWNKQAVYFFLGGEARGSVHHTVECERGRHNPTKVNSHGGHLVQG